MLIVATIALSTPYVQTKLASYAVDLLNKDFKVNIKVDKAKITVFGSVKLQEVLIRDHHKDTLIYSKHLYTNILDFKKLIDGDLIFGDVRLQDVFFNLKTYKNEKETNIDVFINSFETGKPSTGKHTLFTTEEAKIINGRFLLIDENRAVPKDVDFSKLNIDLQNFKLYGPDVDMNIKSMSFKDHRGLYVSDLSGLFSYTKKRIKFQKLAIKTKESTIEGDFNLKYKIEDFADFNNKVKIDFNIKKSEISSNDIRYFFKDLGKNLHFNLKTRLKGTLNNFTLNNLKLFDNQNTRMFGAINFKNIFGDHDQFFYMNGRFTKMTSSYNELVTIMPTILGKKLPVELKKLGKFLLVGTNQLTAKTLKADFLLKTELGNVQSVLSMKSIDFIAKATYVGNVKLDQFNLGAFLEEKDLKTITADIDVDGVGFTKKYLNTALKGVVSEIYYKNYKYTNIDLNGVFKLPNYKGLIQINDPNLKMNFDGLVDIRKNDSRYDFHINVENADFNKLHFSKDSISSFKGDVIVQVEGNTIENLQGSVFVKKTEYKNSKDTYIFDDFVITSSFDADKVRTLNFMSPDIVQGEIVGKFKFKELPGLVRNSLGSLYANFKPEKVNKGQFLKFNFNIYSKIVEIFYPELNLSQNTVLKGNIKSDSQEFKLNFNSPKIVYSDNTFDNIRVSLDNKNPLYNAYIELDSIKTKYYKVRDFSLINVTMKDTLFFRSEFKGGSKGEDYFNLNLFHTINKEKLNVVGIAKSEIKFKDYLWFLNEKDAHNNTMVFDKNFNNFKIDNIILSHQDQEITLSGILKDKTHKDLLLKFDKVDLFKITPANDSFNINGTINGLFTFKQTDKVYDPNLSFVVNDLSVNKIDLGVLTLDVKGDAALEKFSVASVLENKNTELFTAIGNFIVKDKKPFFDLDFKLENFNIGVFSSLGGEVMSNIRGFVTGNAYLGGSVDQPKVSGRLFVEKTGMTIPYLNVDYVLSDRAIIDLIDEKFLFRNNGLTDTKFNTKGILNGVIEHKKFSDWKLKLDITSKRLLVLNTKDKEDAAYYGTAFIDGKATIAGPVSNLFIKVDAKSEKGTTLKIPINNAESVGESSLIHFLSIKEKNNIKNGIAEKTTKYKGLELEFDLDITPDAEVEVILDRNSGHGIKGKGFGSLLFKINTLGKFNMWGDFQAYEGSYNFKYGNLIDKKFDVKKGGTISWEGNPMKANLNLEAVYKTIANPAVLVENSSFNKKVPVNVVIGIKGDLASPEPDFNIEFPTVSNVLKSEIQTRLSDKDIRQTQALYLLSSGGFLSSEGISQSDFSGSLFETASSLLDNIIKTNNDKVQVGFNYVSAGRQIGKETDARVVATISSKINERFTINGKVGVPFGGVNGSVVVGDLEIQYRVNEEGTLNLRLFNRENDVNYFGQGIGYTQGLGVSYEVDFDTFGELLDKIFKKKKNQEVVRFVDQFQDSTIAPEYLNFTKPNDPKKEDPKPNKEAVIFDEDF